MKGGVFVVIITDCMYRSSIPAIYSLRELGEEIIAVTTKKVPLPPAFHSRFIKEKHVLSDDKEAYRNELIELCKKHSRPTILPIGVFTLNIISENLALFNEVADFSVSNPAILERLNDKKASKQLALDCGILVPMPTDSLPAVVKPFCGEKFGLKASERYAIVKTKAELDEAIKRFACYGDAPLVEEYINGDGIGVSVVIGKDGIERSAFCHKRLAEYPSTGGPSSSLVTFKDDEIIAKAVNMLKKAGFVGIAMLEFKLHNGQYYFLEVNPRIWGSFGATYKASSDFIKGYLAGARGLEYSFSPRYNKKKIKFVPNIFASVISYAKAKKIKMALLSFIDAINPFVADAIFSIKDPSPSIHDIFRKRR